MKIDRSKIEDAQLFFEQLLPDLNRRYAVINLLGNVIEYGNDINSSNWNLNLDKDGKFIRFNMGKEYCIDINKKELLVICDRELLSQLITRISGIIYMGYNKDREREHSSSMYDVPNCLKLIPNNVGCILRTQDFDINTLELLKASNLKFVLNSAKEKRSKIWIQSINAHSIGAINFISNSLNRRIPNPTYVSNISTNGDNNASKFLENINSTPTKKINTNSVSADFEINSEIEFDNTKIEGREKIVIQTVYERNPENRRICIEHYKHNDCDKRIKCQVCGFDFEAIYGELGRDFIEVHHKIPLSETRKEIYLDPKEDLLPVCSNCHRMLHRRNNGNDYSENLEKLTKLFTSKGNNT